MYYGGRCAAKTGVVRRMECREGSCAARSAVLGGILHWEELPATRNGVV